MSEASSSLSSKIRQRFETGVTKSKSHREQQLQNLLKGLDQMEQEIIESIQMDLQQGYFVSWQQFAETQKEVNYILKSFKNWQVKSATTDIIQLFSNKVTVKQPKGTVGLIVDLPSSNILQRVLVPLSVAISAGNCVVIKIESPMENTKKAIGKLIHEFLDTFSVKLSQGSMEDLAQSSLDHIHYIGNYANCKNVQKLIANQGNLVTYSYELNFNTPAIITADADIDYAARQIAANKWISAGQNLEVAVSHVYVHLSVSNEFISKLKLYIEKQFGQDARASPEYAKLISGTDALKEKLSGFKIEHGGQFDEKGFLTPTIVASKTLGPTQGPLLSVFPYEKFNRIVARINDLNQDVNLYLFSKNKDSQSFIQQNVVRLNSLYINTCSDFTNPYMNNGLKGLYGYDLVSRQVQITKQRYKLFQFYPPFTSTLQNQIAALYKIPYFPQKNFLYGLTGILALGGYYQYSKKPSKK